LSTDPSNRRVILGHAKVDCYAASAVIGTLQPIATPINISKVFMLATP
jgi:hypothetical protein